jgi:hypothetical protein
MCACTELSCDVSNCTNGVFIDSYGCKTCECIPKCDPIECTLKCEYGYKIDDRTRCKLCACNDPPVCPAVLCTTDCPYYTRTDDATRCPTCDCNPCPDVKCQRYCQYGFADCTNGCPNCTCREKTVCPTLEEQGCNLNCTKGNYMVNGCPVCRCLEKEICECGTKPTTAPVPCKDNTTIRIVTDECQRSDDGTVCNYVVTLCPFGIVIKIKEGETISDADLALIVGILVSAESLDIRIHKEVINGTIYLELYINQEALALGTTAQDVKTMLDAEMAKYGVTGAEASIFDDGSGLTPTETTYTTSTGTTTATSTGTSTGTGDNTNKSDVSKLVLSSLLFVFLMLFI